MKKIQFFIYECSFCFLNYYELFEMILHLSIKFFFLYII
jgi:hypothetical protein